MKVKTYKHSITTLQQEMEMYSTTSTFKDFFLNHRDRSATLIQPAANEGVYLFAVNIRVLVLVLEDDEQNRVADTVCSVSSVLCF